MDIDQGTKECIETFDRADYRNSARQAKRLLSARDDYALWQILLISLQRLEETKEARRVASDLLRISDQDPWQKTLVRLSLGKVSLEKAVAKAENEDQRCQALYYAGARSFTQGRLDEALSRFDSCLFVPSECLEHTLAYFQITTLAPRTAQPSLYLLGRLEAILAQARSFFINGQSEDGLGYCHLCAQYAQKYFEKKHPTIYAQRATAVGGLCVAFEKFFESIMFYGDALRINVQTKGMADRAVAASSQKLAEVYIKLKEYTRAEPMLKRILDIYRDTQGEESSSFINCLGVLAHLQFLKGDLDAAGLLLHQALDIIKRTTCLSDRCRVEVADVCLEMKCFDKAIPLFEQAVASYREQKDVHSELYARALNGLGCAKMVLGSNREPEGLLRIALAIYNHNLGSKSSASRATRSQLSALLGEDCEEDSFPESVAETTNLPGEFLAYLYLFAKLLGAAGQWERAEAILTQLIGHSRSDRTHARTLIQSLLEMAERYESLGAQAAQKGEAGEPAFAQADLFVTEALRTLERVGGAAKLEGFREGSTKPDRYLERGLVLRGLLASARGLHEEAYKLHAEASAIRAGWLINPSRYQGRAMNDIVACVATNRFAEAVEALRRWASDDERLSLPNLLAGSESNLLEYMREFHGLMVVGLSCALCEELGPYGRELVMDMLLRRKGVVADIMRMRAFNSGGQGGIGEAVGQDADDDGNEYRQWLSSINTRRVANALPADSALVEYVRYRRVDFKAVTARGEARWTKARYFALILPAGKPERVEALDLGDADEIDEAIGQWLRHMPGQGRQFQDVHVSTETLFAEPLDLDRDWLAEALNPNTSFGLLSVTYAGTLLRERILDPIRNIVGARTKLVLAPEGMICMVPFQSLTASSGDFVVDEQQIRYVTTGRDLLRARVEGGPALSPPVVVADPDYDGRPDCKASSRAATEGGQTRDNLELAIGHFGRLPGTRQEGEFVANLLGVKPWLDAEALKGRVKALKSPVVLHFATHGFFLPGEVSKQLGPEELRRSGLALTGANQNAAYDPLTSEAENGILTAEDVMSLQLVGTELVVLSACETGVGEIRVGEGVFGLRRAFLIAGARALVVSLWQVPDNETSDLMCRFYKELQKGAGVPEALDAAQREVRSVHPHPYFWGAFLCIGDESPLTVYEKVRPRRVTDTRNS